MHSVFLNLFVVVLTVSLWATLFLIIIREDNADENEKFTVNHTKEVLPLRLQALGKFFEASLFKLEARPLPPTLDRNVLAPF